MPEPLSIATGVAALLKVTLTVVTELQKFHEGVSGINRTIKDLEHDVEGLARVLESMRETFETITAEHGTGNVASHWRNVAQSIEDGKSVLRQLETQVSEINKTSKILDGPRKLRRLNFAEDKITASRMQIQSYRDGLHLSLQTIILWNQVSYQKSADQVLPSINVIHQDIRRIALEMNQRIEALRSVVASKQDEDQVVAMSNLRNCVQSAASIVSSTSTVIQSQNGDDSATVVPNSDFGDCFPAEQNYAIRRWMATRTVYEYDELEQQVAPESIADVPDVNGSQEGSDSDADVELEITTVLLENGKQKLASGDTKNADKMFQNCFKRFSTTRTMKQDSLHVSKHLEVVEHLFQLYYQQERWTDAQSMLTRRMMIKERRVGKEDPQFLEDVLSLARLMQRQGDIIAAQLHARRALKGYRKLRKSSQMKTCLVLLIDLCEATITKTTVRRITSY